MCIKASEIKFRRDCFDAGRIFSRHALEKDSEARIPPPANAAISNKIGQRFFVRNFSQIRK